MQIWPDGAMYEGNWVNNQANGKGKFTYNNRDVYEGNWKNGKANGYGIFTHHSGSRY